MKKYIRTKDGRILEWEKLNEITKLSIDTCEETINQANTIEELCDEFVLFYEETGTSYIPWATYERRGIWEKERENIIKEIVSHPSYRQPVLYGAIWTDKGLSYVSKMNDEGELELL